MPGVDDTVSFGDARDGLIQRAEAAGLQTEIEYWEEIFGPEFEGDKDLYIYLPNGRKKYRVVANEDSAASIAEVSFEHVHVLGKYDAIFDDSNKCIEAVARPVSGGTRVTSRFLRLPGIQLYKCSDDEGEYKILPGGYEELPARKTQAMTDDSDYTWRLPIDVPEQRVRVEISPVSKQAAALLFGVRPSSPSLKISDYSYETHDKCVEYLEQAASSLFFDIDLRFGVGYTLGRQATRGARLGRSRRPDERPIALPSVGYSFPATTLYFYARSVSNNLNRYLAYYQAIEYFFPSFFNREIIDRLRNQLRDPRFNALIDTDVQQLIDLATSGKRQSKTERDQLRATITGSVSDDDVLKFLAEDRAAQEFFRRDNLSGVPLIRPSSTSPSLIEQLTERIYALRCRIVHAKESYGDVPVEPMLPYSDEAERLQHDLDLIQYVCQKVIIAGSR